MSTLSLISENKSQIFRISSTEDVTTFSTSLNIPIEINCQQLNIRNQSGQIINDLVSDIIKIKLIQKCLRSYNGIVFNDNSNHIYEQLLNTGTLSLINNSAVFIDKSEYYQYLRELNNEYYLIVFVETDGNLTINGKLIKNNSWYIIKYTQNPNHISFNSNHLELIDETSIIFLSENTKKIGSQKYPDHSDIEYF